MFKFYIITATQRDRLIGGKLGKFPVLNHVCAKNKKTALRICKDWRAKTELTDPRDHYCERFEVEEIDLPSFALFMRAYNTLWENKEDKEVLAKLIRDNLNYPYEYYDCWQGTVVRPEGIEKLKCLSV